MDTLLISIFINIFYVDEIYLDASNLGMNLFNTLGNPFSMWFSYGDNKAFCLK